MYKIFLETRAASKGVAVVEYPFETVLKFYSDPAVSKKINDQMIKF